MHLAQDRDQWAGSCEDVINIRLPQKEGNFLTS
jgi:hypothetical protein